MKPPRLASRPCARNVAIVARVRSVRSSRSVARVRSVRTVRSSLTLLTVLTLTLFAATACKGEAFADPHSTGAPAMSSTFDTLPGPGHFRDVTPADVVAHRGAVKLIDVRETHEFTGELGHIEGAELVPLATVAAAAEGWDKDAEIVLVCRSGGRSGRAADALARAGFTRVSNMVGGMLRWNDEQRSVAR